MKLLGIDNVFFTVGNLERALEIYLKLGFTLKFKIPAMPGALLNIGDEEPGLIIVQTNELKPSRLWIEVKDSNEAQTISDKIGLHGEYIETATGMTYEITDEWGNKIGFADYSKKPELARAFTK